MKNKKMNHYNIKLLLFNIVFILILKTIKSFKFFRAYNLISDDILLVTDEGIIKYNIESTNQSLITSINYNIDGIEDLEYINFVQYSSADEGYIFCRTGKYIYIISKDENTLLDNINLEEIYDKSISILVYKSKSQDFYFIIKYINSGSIKTIIYKINFIPNYSKEEIINEIQKYYGENNNDFNIQFNSGISCELMYSPNYENNILVCFVTKLINDCCYRLIALAVDPENKFFIL